MRLFIIFLFLVFTLSTQAFADGQKSFDTSMVPKKGAVTPARPPQQPAAQPPKHPAAQQLVEPRRPYPPKAQNVEKPQKEEEPSSLMEQVLNERNSNKNHGSGMRTRTMSVPDDIKDKRKVSNNEHDDSEPLEEPKKELDASEEDTKQEKSKSSEQSIWDRYKAIANGADDNMTMKSNVNMSENGNQIDTPEEEDLSEKDKEKEQAAKEYEKKKAQAGVLGRALNDYKNNKKARKINSRSYGSLND